MTITEVSRLYDLTPDTLRYYERIGLIPSVTRAESGVRNYSEDDCRWVEFAKCMRLSGVQVEALIEYVLLFQRGNSTQEARMHILAEQREQLAGKIEYMQATLNRLDTKIENYSECMAKAEKELRK